MSIDILNTFFYKVYERFNVKNINLDIINRLINKLNYLKTSQMMIISLENKHYLKSTLKIKNVEFEYKSY